MLVRGPQDAGQEDVAAGRGVLSLSSLKGRLRITGLFSCIAQPLEVISHPAIERKNALFCRLSYACRRAAGCGVLSLSSLKGRLRITGLSSCIAQPLEVISHPAIERKNALFCRLSYAGRGFRGDYAFQIGVEEFA